MFVTRVAAAGAGGLIAAALLAGCSISGSSGSSTSSGSSVPGASVPHGVQSTSGIAVDQAARALLPESVRKSGVLKIASDPTYAPFEFIDSDNKTMVGWDVDYSNALAAVLGLKPQHISAGFDTILPGLASGKYDMAISAFNMTAEREKVVDFVEYQYGGSGVAVLPGNPEDIHMDAMSMCGKRIAGMKGSVQTSVVIPEFTDECTSAGKPAITLLNYPTQNEANLAVVSGRADGIVADTVSLKYQGILSGNKFELVEGDAFEPEATGLALNKQSGMKSATVAAAKVVIGSDYYATISDKWGIPQQNLITPSALDGKTS